MKKILVTTDFSVAGSNAVEYAASMANYYNSSLILLHAYQSPIYYTVDMPLSLIEETEKMVLEQANNKIESIQSELSLKYPGLSVKPMVEKGLIGETAARIANDANADVTVAGTTGASGIEQVILGSSAMEIVKRANNMVLLIPHNFHFKPYDKIVFATDLNKQHLMQYRQLDSIIEKGNPELCFLFVDATIHSDGELLDEKMSELIKENVPYPVKSGFISTDQNIEHGINEFLLESDADLLVMVNEPLRFPESLFHRSHTKRISKKISKPLLTLKPSAVSLTA
jgi:nucleotide-binding universal stress UspA family protein